MVQNFMNFLSDVLKTGQTISLGVAAVMILIIGYQFMANGDEGQRKGKQMFIWTVVGLVVIWGASAIVQMVKGWIAF